MNKWLRANRGLLVALLLFGVFRTAVADWNPVPSGSMRPTIQEGDVVLVNRLAFDFKLPLTNIIIVRTGEPVAGDIVTFESPRDGIRLVKRLVAVPGDLVEMHDKILAVNGKAATYTHQAWVRENMSDDVQLTAHRLREEAGGRSPRTVQWLRPQGGFAGDSFGPVTVPADHFLMLGDSRDNSIDSRVFGLVPRALLIGRAERVLVAADIKGNWMPRFERFGKRLR